MLEAGRLKVNTKLPDFGDIRDLGKRSPSKSYIQYDVYRYVQKRYCVFRGASMRVRNYYSESFHGLGATYTIKGALEIPWKGLKLDSSFGTGSKKNARFIVAIKILISNCYDSHR